MEEPDFSDCIIMNYHAPQWKLTVHNEYDKDKRDLGSTKACVHESEGMPCQNFQLVRVGSYYKIVSLDDKYKQAGWKLTAHKHYDKDKRDDGSIYAFFHRGDLVGQQWELIPTSFTSKRYKIRPKTYKIRLADGDYKGWYLCAIRYYIPEHKERGSDSDYRDENSTYLCVHRDLEPTYWVIEEKGLTYCNSLVFADLDSCIIHEKNCPKKPSKTQNKEFTCRGCRSPFSERASHQKSCPHYQEVKKDRVQIEERYFH